jgi:transcriptional regulator with XRE-family HTH domain
MHPSISNAESLVLARRRLGLTQLEVAQQLSLNVSKYKRLEAEEGKDVGRSARELLPDAFLGRSPEDLDPHEECYILRRRHGLSQLDVGKSIGRCREWIQQMERGEVDCAELTMFWRLVEAAKPQPAQGNSEG